MTTLSANLELGRCPHCRIDQPNLVLLKKWETKTHAGLNPRFWAAYRCGRCGGVCVAASPVDEGQVTEVYPAESGVDNALPEKVRAYLGQAIDSVHAPAGAVMLAASAVDAMLKEKGYSEGNLYKRIDKARDDHLITHGMAEWAHQIRLDANDQRHADKDASLPDSADARRSIDFATALGQFLYTLPARVERGLVDAKT